MIFTAIRHFKVAKKNYISQDIPPIVCFYKYTRFCYTCNKGRVLVDFVYICKSGDNEELRYSIRSVVNSFPDANVWLVGGKPDWYSGNHIYVDQKHHKYANAINNLNALCDSNEISNEFVLMNDDFFIIKKIDRIDQFYNGLLSEKIDKYTKITGSSMYIKKLILTNTRLIDQGISKPYDYELHVPMVMQRDKLLPILKKYPSCLWRSMYGNIHNVGGTQIEDVKVYTNPRHTARSNEITTNSIFMSTEDQAFKMMLDKVLIKMFPDKSKYEYA